LPAAEPAKFPPSFILIAEKRRAIRVTEFRPRVVWFE
jgi:hypothetical protein